jgi:hypothetical protein
MQVRVAGKRTAMAQRRPVREATKVRALPAGAIGLEEHFA